MSSNSYLHQLESLALLPPFIRAILTESEKLWGEHRWLAILVVNIMPYVEMIIQSAQNTLQLYDDGLISELQATSVSRLYASWIPVIEQNQGAVLELNATGLLVIWGIPASEDFLIKAINTALMMQQTELNGTEVPDFSGLQGCQIGLATGQTYVGTIGPETHQNYTVAGPTLLRAMQLSKIAEPGQILVDHNVYERTYEEFVYQRHADGTKDSNSLLWSYMMTGTKPCA